MLVIDLFLMKTNSILFVEKKKMCQETFWKAIKRKNFFTYVYFRSNKLFEIFQPSIMALFSYLFIFIKMFQKKKR